MIEFNKGPRSMKEISTRNIRGNTKVVNFSFSSLNKRHSIKMWIEAQAFFSMSV